MPTLFNRMQLITFEINRKDIIKENEVSKSQDIDTDDDTDISIRRQSNTR